MRPSLLKACLQLAFLVTAVAAPSLRAEVFYAWLMDATDHFDHTGPDGATFDQRIVDAGGSGFATMGENIALGQRTPAEVTRAGMASPGHRRNILNRRLRLAGFGKAGGEP